MPLGGLLTVGIMAGTSIYAAHKQSQAAQKGVDAQTAATDKAIELRKPYVDTGTKAFNTLGALMGLGGGGAGGGSAAQSTANTPWGGTVMDDGQRGSITNPAIQPDASQGPTGFIGNQSQSQRAQNPITTSSYSTPGMHGSSTNVPQVTMKAPDGSTKSIPADQVSYWQQKGATVVGNSNG